MGWLWTVLLSVYCTGLAVTFVLLFVELDLTLGSGYKSGHWTDYLIIAVLAGIPALVWPLSLLLAIGGLLFRR